MRTLSQSLTDEMNSLSRTPASQVTVEQWLPDWTARIEGLSGGETEQYAHGHAATVSIDGNGSGEDIIFRARSGSYASPQDGKLYVAVLKGADLNAPTTWDTLWVDSGKTGLMYPAWTSNSGAAYGGSIAVAAWDNAGTPYGRIFYTKTNGYLYCLNVNLDTGAIIGGETSIANLGTGVQLASMQIACCQYDEVFVLINSLVEASLAGWQPDVYGSLVRRYYYSGGWYADNSFFFHTHAEGGLLRDTPDEGSTFGDTSCEAVTAQWGKRPCGGLAANNIDTNTVVISLGLTWWRRWGYDTHAQGIISFIYHRDCLWWERGCESGRADFNEDGRLNYDVFARGFAVEGRQFVAWSRYVEPADYVQAESAQTIPRTRETVVARLSDDGKHLTHFQYLGDPDELTAPAIVAVNHDGAKKLYALGWRSVYESDPAAFICDAGDDAQNMEMYIDGWNLSRNNRKGMTLGLNVLDPSILTDTATIVKSGALAKVDFGVPGELVQVGQGYLDLTTPTLQTGANGFSEGAQITARADKLLFDTRAEWGEDGLPQNILAVPADDTEKLEHVSLHNGVWKVVSMEWPDLFYSSAYTALSGDPAYRLLSFPFAQTGGDLRTNLKGSWFKDVLWLGMTPMVDGAIEASVRFGDVFNQSNFSFVHSSGVTIYATITRSNGVITQIKWGTSPGGGQISTATQYACMAGVICHAPEIGRKYAFVLERHSTFSTSSHTDDTWTKENFDRADYSTHGTGENKLYLIVSDYDGSNWVNKSVAGGTTATGLTAGYPADLKMVVLGGTIHCYYRQHSTGTPNQWRYAFSYKAGRFGAGRFGIVGRGHAGLQWYDFRNGVQYISKCDNVVDFWDIKLTDAVQDRPLEEHLQRLCWRGFTASEFESKVDDSGRTVTAGTSYNYEEPVENPTIDFKVNIPANTNEAGVFVRGVGIATPTNNCIKLGLVAHSTANTATNTVNYYLVKRYYTGGAEVAASREYSPLPIQLKPGLVVPVRVTVRGPVYSVWIAGNFAGHFVDDTELGLYFGLYATGGNAVFSDVHVPELYEVPGYATLSAGQKMEEALSGVLGNRKIKAFFTHEGILKFGYFLTHDEGPSFEDALFRSTYQRNDRFYSIVKVEGADGAHAAYTSTVLLARGRRFHVVSNPEITHREHAYREAMAIATETAEQMGQATFEGLVDVRLEPEDAPEIVVTRQNIAGDFLVDDITIDYKGGDNPDCGMTVSTRQSVVL